MVARLPSSPSKQATTYPTETKQRSGITSVGMAPERDAHANCSLPASETCRADQEFFFLGPRSPSILGSLGFVWVFWIMRASRCVVARS